jgi:hypothetical protein
MERSLRCSRNVGDARANGSSNRMAAHASIRKGTLSPRGSGGTFAAHDCLTPNQSG